MSKLKFDALTNSFSIGKVIAECGAAASDKQLVSTPPSELSAGEQAFFDESIEKLSPAKLKGFQQRRFTISRFQSRNGNIASKIEYFAKDKIRGTIYVSDLNGLEVNEDMRCSVIRINFGDRDNITLRFTSLDQLRKFRAAFRAAFPEKKISVAINT